MGWEEETTNSSTNSQRLQFIIRNNFGSHLVVNCNCNATRGIQCCSPMYLSLEQIPQISLGLASEQTYIGSQGSSCLHCALSDIKNLFPGILPIVPPRVRKAVFTVQMCTFEAASCYIGQACLCQDGWNVVPFFENRKSLTGRWQPSSFSFSFQISVDGDLFFVQTTAQIPTGYTGDRR